MRRGVLCSIAWLLAAAPAAAGTPDGIAAGLLAPRAVRSGDALLPSRALRIQAAEARLAADGLPEAGSTSNTRYVLPVLLSAAVPGLGEIATGHWLRGLPFVAADAATWIFHAHFQKQGRDWRTTYEAYADAHWHYTGDANGNGVIDAGSETAGWQERLQQYYDGQYGENYDYWDPSLPYNCNCPYITAAADRQHYYENVGKYLYYYPGWDDWVWNGDPATADSQAHRAEYAHMRQESNRNFDRGTEMLYVAMATRLASITQTVLLMRNETRHLEVRPIRTSGRGAGVEIAYRY